MHPHVYFCRDEQHLDDRQREVTEDGFQEGRDPKVVSLCCQEESHTGSQEVSHACLL